MQFWTILRFFNSLIVSVPFTRGCLGWAVAQAKWHPCRRNLETVEHTAVTQVINNNNVQSKVFRLCCMRTTLSLGFVHTQWFGTAKRICYVQNYQWTTSKQRRNKLIWRRKLMFTLCLSNKQRSPAEERHRCSEGFK